MILFDLSPENNSVKFYLDYSNLVIDNMNSIKSINYFRAKII